MDTLEHKDQIRRSKIYAYRSEPIPEYARILKENWNLFCNDTVNYKKISIHTILNVSNRVFFYK